MTEVKVDIMPEDVQALKFILDDAGVRLPPRISLILFMLYNKLIGAMNLDKTEGA